MSNTKIAALDSAPGNKVYVGTSRGGMSLLHVLGNSAGLSAAKSWSAWAESGETFDALLKRTEIIVDKQEKISVKQGRLGLAGR